MNFNFQINKIVNSNQHIIEKNQIFFHLKQELVNWRP